MLTLLGHKSSILSPSVLISSGSLKQPVKHPARVLVLFSGTYFQDLTLWFLLRTLCRRAALQRGGMYFAFTGKSPWEKQMGNVAAGKLGGLHGESLKKKKSIFPSLTKLWHFLERSIARINIKTHLSTSLEISLKIVVTGDPSLFPTLYLHQEMLLIF